MRISELAERAGTTVRTVRYYAARGLLPAPVGAGPRSAYTDEHLVRLAAIRALKARYVPLAEIRRRLATMRPADVEALATAPQQDDAADAIGLPLGGGPASVSAEFAGRPTAAHAVWAGFGLPSARPDLPRGAASSTPLPQPGSDLWQRVLLAPGVELSFQPTDDPTRARAIAELIELATHRLAEPT